MADELERIGDYAEGIAKITLIMGEQPPIKPLIDIPRMADIAREMMRGKPRRAGGARHRGRVGACGSGTTRWTSCTSRSTASSSPIMIEDPKKIERATYLIWVAHNIERIADRATNIAERVIFVSTGQIPTREEWWDKRLTERGNGADGRIPPVGV